MNRTYYYMRDEEDDTSFLNRYTCPFFTHTPFPYLFRDTPPNLFSLTHRRG